MNNMNFSINRTCDKLELEMNMPYSIVIHDLFVDFMVDWIWENEDEFEKFYTFLKLMNLSVDIATGKEVKDGL